MAMFSQLLPKLQTFLAENCEGIKCRLLTTVFCIIKVHSVPKVSIDP
jgi:hypothetical protein